jgi:hypothetical protein
MDFTPGRQRLLFVVVVLALIGLGIFLVNSHDSNDNAGTAPGTPTPGTRTGGATAQPTGAAYTPPATLPAATPVSTAGGAEIYQWLPFTASDLNAAVQATVTFAKAYVTWSYTENKAAYQASLSRLVTAQELPLLMAGYTTPGVSSQRVQQKQVSVGSGTIDSISAFSGGQVTITFAVTINQRVTSTQPTKTSSSKYNVTVAESGSTWQVDNIELSSLGNQ